MENISSLPKEFEERLRNKLGSSFQEFAECLSQASPVSIRVNPNKSFRLNSGPVAWSRVGKYLEERPVFTLDPIFHGGGYYVQEASSMFLEQAFAQSTQHTRPLRVLDLCAAPGGKSTHLLSLLNSESLLVSNEVIRSRASILSENIQKWGHTNVVITNNDPEDFSALKGFFDVIVVDAPCSGEGLFRKDPNAMLEWSPANVELCAARQRRILANVWPALKSNGILIYSTCTYNNMENEENIQWLNSQQSIESIPLEINSAWGIEETKVGSLVGYRFYPHKVKGEGFFLSVIKKLEDETEIKIKPKKQLPIPSKKVIDQLSQWTTYSNANYFTWNDTVYLIPTLYQNEAAFLAQHLKIIQAGTALATIKHDKLIPDHNLALSIHLNHDHFQNCKVDLTKALQFLRKEPFDISDLPKGYTLVIYEGIVLGWINVLDNRMNNLYPKEWRIRIQ